MERIAENKCGGVEKASWLGEVGRLWVVGRLILTTIMWLNQIPSLLSSLALCKERVWPGAHVQIWVLVIGLLPTVAKVKLLCALCCWFLRVTVVFCFSAASPTFYYYSWRWERQRELHLVAGLFVSISSFLFRLWLYYVCESYITLCSLSLPSQRAAVWFVS